MCATSDSPQASGKKKRLQLDISHDRYWTLRATGLLWLIGKCGF